MPQLDDEGEKISIRDLEKVLDLFKDGVLVKEGIPNALIQSSNNEEIEINSGNIDNEVRDFINDLIKNYKIEEKWEDANGVNILYTFLFAYVYLSSE